MKATTEKTKILSLKTQSNLIRLAFYLVIVVLLNLASSTFFVRFDLTAKGVYSLSEASKKAVSTLAEPLTVKAFFSKNLPGNYSTLEQTVRDLLDEYKIYGKAKFNFEFITMGESDKSAPAAKDADTGKETNEQKAQSYSIYPVQIQSFEQDEVKLISSYMGLAFIHGSQIESIAALDPAENFEYKITSTIQKMNNKTSALLRIKEGDIQVKVFLSAHLAQLKTLGPEIEKAVNDINPKLSGRLKYTLLNPDNDSAVTAEADKLNVFALQLQGNDKKPLPYKSYAGLVIALGDQSYPIPLLTQIPLFGYQAANVESLKTSIEGVATKMIGAFQEMGYLTSNGALPLYGDYSMSATGQRNEGLSNFNKQIADIYTLKEANLAEGIPSGVKTLIIAKPKENFSDYDLFQIDQFLMQGGSLAVFMDGLDEAINPNYQGNYGGSPANYTPLKTGLEKLLNHYGVNVKPAYVLDEKCYINRQNAQTGSIQETPLYYVPMISDKYISNDLAFIKNINQLILLKTSPLELFQDKLGDKVKSHLLVSSSDKSWEVSENINLYDPYGMAPPADNATKKSRPLAYLLEGQFTSYFKDKQIPEKPQAANTTTDAAKPAAESVIKQTEVAKAESFVPQSKGGKLFVIGDSTILENNVLGDTAENPNAQFLLNVLDHLNDRDAFAVMRSKGEAVNPLRETDKLTKDMVRNINVFVLPLLGLIAGIIFWFTWENRKKRIQALFTKEQQ